MSIAVLGGTGGGMAIGDLITGATQGSVLFAGAAGILAQDNTNFYFDDANNELRVGSDSTKNAKLILATEAADTRALYYNATTAPFNTAYGTFDLEYKSMAAANNGSPITSFSAETLSLSNPNAISSSTDDDIWENYGSSKTMLITGAHSTGSFNLRENNYGEYINLIRSGTHTAPELYVTNTGYYIQLNETQTYNNIGGALDITNSAIVANVASNAAAPTGSLTKTNIGLSSRVTAATTGITINYGANLYVQGADTNIGIYLNTVSGGTTNWGIYDQAAANHLFRGKIYSGTSPTAPTARLHFAAHPATANTAPIKFTSGTAMTSPEDGALEYHSSHLYFTIGSTRYQLDQQSGGGTWTETEIDFGTTPQYSKTFTITDASVSGTSKIIVAPSGNVATSRTGNDLEWDNLLLGALAGTGSFTLTALALPGPVVGKRKVYYQVN